MAAAAAERDARIAALEAGLQAASHTHANLLAAVEDARQLDSAAAAAAEAAAAADAARSDGARLAAALATLQDRTGTLQQEVYISSYPIPLCCPQSDGQTRQDSSRRPPETRISVSACFPARVYGRAGVRREFS